MTTFEQLVKHILNDDQRIAAADIVIYHLMATTKYDLRKFKDDITFHFGFAMEHDYYLNSTPEWKTKIINYVTSEIRKLLIRATMIQD